MKHISLPACFCTMIALGGAPALAANDWFDSYYQYRIPIVVEAPAAGWNTIVLNEAQITTAGDAPSGPPLYVDRMGNLLARTPA